jgi:hypothetical protein
VDAVALQRAQGMGLRVEPKGDKLLVCGPKRLEPMVKLLAEHKAEVLAVLGNLHESEPRPESACGRRRAWTGDALRAGGSVDELKKWKEPSCTSASSAEPLGRSTMTSVYMRGGSAVSSDTLNHLPREEIT